MAGMERLPLRLRRHVLFGVYQHRWGNFSAPRTFSEKVNWRMLYDRRPELAWTCDKLAMKERAAACGVRTSATWWSGTDIADLAGVDFRGEWVLKPNHRSGVVLFGVGAADVDSLRRQTAGWLDNFQWEAKGEWAYSVARPLLLLEERLPLDVAAEDFKVWTFGGEPHIIQVDTDRFGDHTRRFYAPDWVPLECEQAYPMAAPMPRPDGLAELLDAARAMSAGLDFLRVDLYLVDGRVYLGEVTPYPGGGLDPIRPHSFEVGWGGLWRLPVAVER
jgi:hypothetical protein